ncbi:hypothetical protein M0804_013958 [Polistes exclamans]|nr:hypothetical protein M0804_013958 [Polistes exclamans]
MPPTKSNLNNVRSKRIEIANQSREEITARRGAQRIRTAESRAQESQEQRDKRLRQTLARIRAAREQHIATARVQERQKQRTNRSLTRASFVRAAFEYAPDINYSAHPKIAIGAMDKVCQYCQTGRSTKKLREFIRGAEAERARRSNIKGEVSGRMKRCLKGVLEVAGVMDERLGKQTGASSSKTEAVIQLRAEMRVTEKQKRDLGEEYNKLRRELWKKESAPGSTQKEKTAMAAPKSSVSGVLAARDNLVSLDNRLEAARYSRDADIANIMKSPLLVMRNGSHHWWGLRYPRCFWAKADDPVV